MVLTVRPVLDFFKPFDRNGWQFIRKQNYLLLHLKVVSFILYIDGFTNIHVSYLILIYI